MTRALALTPRETVVATYLATGASNQEIATELTISVRTAEAHIEAIRLKEGQATVRRLVAHLARTSNT